MALEYLTCRKSLAPKKKKRKEQEAKRKKEKAVNEAGGSEMAKIRIKPVGGAGFKISLFDFWLLHKSR